MTPKHFSLHFITKMEKIKDKDIERQRQPEREQGNTIYEFIRRIE